MNLGLYLQSLYIYICIYVYIYVYMFFSSGYIYKDWRCEEKVMTEDKVTGWYHWFNGLEFEWTPGIGDGQGGQACCSPWGCKESDTTERLNWTEQW